MALIVEDGTGKSDAESYVSVAEAIVYITKFYPSSTFLTSTTEEQEAFCRQATQYLDMRYGGRWLGEKANKTQALDWPRQDAEIDGYLQESNSLPQKLKDAAFESIQIFVAGDDPFEANDSFGTVKSEAVKVGPISESIEYMGGKSSYKKYPKVDNIVRAITESAGSIERG